MSVDWEAIEHHNYKTALLKAYNAAATARSGTCVLITGPTGVGKSFVLEMLLDMLVGPPNSWPEGELHYIYVECDRETPGAVTRNIAVDINRALGNPFVSLQLPLHDAASVFGPIRVRLNEHDLRETARVLCALKKTRFIGIDAMENIVPKQAVSGEARFDSIKSLVRPHRKHQKAHNLVLIMAGHYHLLKYWQVNAQLARRVIEIPVLPYCETKHDIERFELILQSISPYYPLKEGASLRDWNDVLFRLSVGCIGILRATLDQAEIERISRGGRHLKLQDVIAGAMPRAKLSAVKHDLDGFWDYLDTSATKKIVGAAKDREMTGNSKSPESRVERRGRVGRRNVGPRDPVGIVR